MKNCIKKSFVAVVATLFAISFIACSSETEDNSKLLIFAGTGTDTGTGTESSNHTHTYSTSWTSDADDHWHAATCGDTANVKDKASHEWDKGTVVKAATCTEEGTKKYTCTVCNAEKTQVIAASHTWNKGVLNEAELKKNYTCTTCGTTKVQNVVIKSFEDFLKSLVMM